MRSRIAAAVCASLLASAAVGCVSLKRSASARFFVLRPVAEPAEGAIGPATESVAVLPVRLPGHLERPQIVTEAGGNELRIDEFVRWAEPIGPAVTRVLARDLSALLVDRRVLQSPWRADEAPSFRVQVDVESFAPQADGDVRLVGRWSLLGAEGGGALARRHFELHRGPFPVGPGGMEPSAATSAMSDLLGDLAVEIAGAIRALSPD